MHGAPVPEALLTTPQVAQQLRVSHRTVHRLVAANKLRVAQKLDGPNGAFLYDPADVASYIEAHVAA